MPDKLERPSCLACNKKTLEWLEDNSCVCNECAACFVMVNGYYGGDGSTKVADED